MKCDVDIHKELHANVVLPGRTTMFQLFFKAHGGGTDDVGSIHDEDQVVAPPESRCSLSAFLELAICFAARRVHRTSGRQWLLSCGVVSSVHRAQSRASIRSQHACHTRSKAIGLLLFKRVFSPNEGHIVLFFEVTPPEHSPGQMMEHGQTEDFLVPPVMERSCEHIVEVSVPQVAEQSVGVPKSVDSFHERREEPIGEQVVDELVCFN